LPPSYLTLTLALVKFIPPPVDEVANLYFQPVLTVVLKVPLQVKVPEPPAGTVKSVVAVEPFHR
jgi:hypothetical protein